MNKRMRSFLFQIVFKEFILLVTSSSERENDGIIRVVGKDCFPINNCFINQGISAFLIHLLPFLK